MKIKKLSPSFFTFLYIKISLKEFFNDFNLKKMKYCFQKFYIIKLLYQKVKYNYYYIIFH